MFEKMCSVLGATHHITLPHHPEGHALIEREFRDINAMIRALATKGYDDWPDHIGAIQFALNTAYSRALGTSPFEALHGFAPRTLLANAVDADPVDPEDPALADPQELGARLVTRATRLRVQVEELRKKIHESNAHRWRRKARGSANFRCGSYVLLRTTLKDKTQVRWTGPYVVVRRAEGVENAYVITDLAHQRADPGGCEPACLPPRSPHRRAALGRVGKPWRVLCGPRARSLHCRRQSDRVPCGLDWLPPE